MGTLIDRNHEMRSLISCSTVLFTTALKIFEENFVGGAFDEEYDGNQMARKRGPGR